VTSFKGGAMSTNPSIQKTTSRLQSREQWLAHIERWKASNISQQAYCSQQEISLNTFTYWRGKFLSESCDQQAKFSPVKIASNKAPISTETPRSIQIKLISGHVVYIPTTLGLPEIASLINAIGVPHA
jgi:hypothetical protein